MNAVVGVLSLPPRTVGRENGGGEGVGCGGGGLQGDLEGRTELRVGRKKWEAVKHAGGKEGGKWGKIRPELKTGKTTEERESAAGRIVARVSFGRRVRCGDDDNHNMVKDRREKTD